MMVSLLTLFRLAGNILLLLRWRRIGSLFARINRLLAANSLVAFDEVVAFLQGFRAARSLGHFWGAKCSWSIAWPCILWSCGCNHIAAVHHDSCCTDGTTCFESLVRSFSFKTDLMAGLRAWILSRSWSTKIRVDTWSHNAHLQWSTLRRSSTSSHGCPKTTNCWSTSHIFVFARQCD